MGRCSQEGIIMTPDYLNEVVKGTENIVADTNLAIIKVLAAKILKQYSKYGEITFIPSTQKQFRAMMGTGMVASTIEEELTKELPNLQKEIHSAFIDSANEMSIEQAHIAKSIIDVEGIDYDLKKIPSQTVVTDKASELNMTPSQVRLLEDSYKQTNKLMKNLVNTSGVCTEVNFVELCDETYMKVRHGMSMDQAIVEVIDGLAKKGIVVQYGNRMDSIETALTRAVRTAINQTNARIVLQNCAEMGVGWVKVSEHLGARVTGTSDYKDHSWWQGKVYSLDWNKGALASYKPSDKLPNKFEYISKIKDIAERKQVEKYEDFVETCGYGDILGICGVNCRHTFHSWYPGINIDRDPEIDPDENKKRYEQEQKARAMERSIRKDRRELVVKQAEIDNLPEGAEKDQAQARFDELSYRDNENTKIYNNFVRKNKLTNRINSLRVSENRNQKGNNIVEHEFSTKSTSEHDFGVKVDYESETYLNRLFALEEKDDVIHSIINETKAVLRHRNNTKYEDLVFIDAGGKVSKQTSYNVESAVSPTTEMLNMLNSNEEYTIIAIHNHPESGFMSYDDLYLAALRKYKYGLIIGHDGTIYKYRCNNLLPNTKDMKKLSEEERLIAYLIENARNTINNKIGSVDSEDIKDVANGLKTLYNYGIEVDIL
jgi:proteasome lid subunit RPN8/RPN11